MSFLGKAWKVIVGIKDVLVLLFMLLFFMALFAILSASPNPGQVRDGALYIDLSGYIVEEAAMVDPIDLLLAGEAPPLEHQARDLVRALDAAVEDDRINAVVLDMSNFIGGGQVNMQEVAEAVARVRDAEKPVFTYAMAYGDDHMHLAANASEVWVNPMGGALIAGPGGSNIYYAGLLEKLKVKANVYRVGEFKSAVEPYLLDGPSPAARENYTALLGAMWEEWQANVKKARPDMDIDRVTSEPVEWVDASSGDLAKAALEAGLVDKLGDKVAFGERVAEVAGVDDLDETPGSYAKSELQPFLADVGPGTGSSDNQIAVVTVSGVIVDGTAGPGTAGGTRIADLLDSQLANEDLKGLVVRVNSPGGSVTASEEIRNAILRYKAKEIPVAISFGNVAASGGYWVATAGDRIFAQPETVTGSIGVFAVIPSFEGTAAELGVNAAGVRTTPLSGQPDVLAGFTPEVNTIFQASVENTYSQFLARVGEARGMDTQRVDEIAQGRVWDGGSARQLQLVDQFGGMQEALEWVAGQASLEEGDWSVSYLGSQQDNYDSLIRQLVTGGAAPEASGSNDMFAMAARQRMGVLDQISRDVTLLSGTQGVQAYCLECPNDYRPSTPRETRGVLEMIGAWLSQ